MSINFYIMDTFSSRILWVIRDRWLIFPGLDDTAILEQVVPVAEDAIVTRIVTDHLSEEDQKLFRDAYLSGPDIFDPVEFLTDTVPDFDTLVDQYFDLWLDWFYKNLQK